MIYGLVIAGGLDQIESGGIPKQFLKIRHKAIVSYTVDAFLNHQSVDKVVVMVPEEWMEYTRDLFMQDFGESDSILIAKAGGSKVDTIIKGVEFIRESLPCDEETIVVSHEGIRPFVSQEIIDRNIDAMKNYDACDTVVPMRESIFESSDNDVLTSVISRKNLYRGQTPQTFKLSKFEELYDKLSEEDRAGIRSATHVFSSNGERVGLVEGDESNINISTNYNLEVAKTMMNQVRSRGVRGIL